MYGTLVEALDADRYLTPRGRSIVGAGQRALSRTAAPGGTDLVPNHVPCVLGWVGWLSAGRRASAWNVSNNVGIRDSVGICCTSKYIILAAALNRSLLLQAGARARSP